MKRLLSVVLLFTIIFMLCACKAQAPAKTEKAENKPTQTKKPEPYVAVKEIDHYILEPDDQIHMNEEDEQFYRMIMDSMFNRVETIELTDSADKNWFYLDMVMQSPYFFIVDEYRMFSDYVTFAYKYTEEEQQQVIEFMDTELLKIINTNAEKDDNELDVLLKTHASVASALIYDHDRTDNKKLGSYRFSYPFDEVYRALRDKKGVCYSYAYILRYALLQRGIDCFCVYGQCTNMDEAHMWNVFKYNDKFYTCDPAWDRAEEGLPKLYQFGKTDSERVTDMLAKEGFSSFFYEEYGKVKCEDDMFRMFRGTAEYEYIGNHKYRMIDFNGKESIFDSQTLEFE